MKKTSWSFGERTFRDMRSGGTSIRIVIGEVTKIHEPERVEGKTEIIVKVLRPIVRFEGPELVLATPKSMRELPIRQDALYAFSFTPFRHKTHRWSLVELEPVAPDALDEVAARLKERVASSKGGPPR